MYMYHVCISVASSWALLVLSSPHCTCKFPSLSPFYSISKIFFSPSLLSLSLSPPSLLSLRLSTSLSTYITYSTCSWEMNFVLWVSCEDYTFWEASNYMWIIHILFKNKILWLPTCSKSHLYNYLYVFEVGFYSFSFLN